MVKNNKTVQQQATRRSARIAARTTSSNASVTSKSAHHGRNVTAARNNKRKRLVELYEEVVSVELYEEGTSDQNTDKRHKQIATSRKAIRKAIIPTHETKVVSVELYKEGTSDRNIDKRLKQKRGNNVVEDDNTQILNAKRRKWNTFIVPIPTFPKRIGQVYAIGSNDMSQCGVDISAGALHSAALTSDGKVVT
ncbi:unnamed protein product [Rhizophagus irregularis]|nr:unnamed protein product [Rhizophagus irregularis]